MKKLPLLTVAIPTLFGSAHAAVNGLDGEFLLLNSVSAAEIATEPANATLGFDIQLNFINPPSAPEAAAFATAEGVWEGLITGYQIDDIHNTSVQIDVNLAPIDGVGGTLGSAGPDTAKLNAAQTAVTATFLYTQTGTMTFDTADTANMDTNGILDDVILHEMGHVLGIGTLWSSSGAGIGGRQELYVDGTGQYTGANGIAAYNSEFSQVGAFVPVELGGGPGTEDAHWNENDGGGSATGIVSNITGDDMQDELMTGWVGGDTFMSTLTEQGMVDLGYTIIPEPGSVALLAGGLVLLGLRRRSR